MNFGMDMDTEETSPTTRQQQQRQRDGLSELPKDDFGTVRERRDFGPLEVSLLPILPSPFRDLSFSGLTGWRYHPTAYEEDRLTMGRLLEGRPSNRMIIPDSWNDRIIDHTAAIESTRRQFEKLNSVENSKRRKVNSAETETESTLLEEIRPSASILPTTELVPFETPAMNVEVDDHDMESSKPDSIPTEEATVVTASTSSTNTDVASVTTMINPALDLAGPDVIPKQELYFLYGKKPRTVQLKASDYLTWDNGKPVQSVKFTSAFVCPITKEIFLAKSYGDPSSFEKDGGIYWYPKKNLAEHAAAARAVDCWNLREGRHDKKRLSLEIPYSVEDAPELPISQFPTLLREKVMAIQREKADLDVSMNMKPAATNRPPAVAASSNTEGRGWYGSRNITANEYRRDGLDNTSGRFMEQYSTHGEALTRQVKPAATNNYPTDAASNTESKRWYTTGSRSTSDGYRRDGSESNRFVEQYGNNSSAPATNRNYQGNRAGNNYYQNTQFAGRHSYQSNDASTGRAYGRGQTDHYYYHQSTTSQSGRWRQSNESVTTRRLQDRYGDDPKPEPPTTSKSNDDEW